MPTSKTPTTRQCNNLIKVATKIYSANIIIGIGASQVTLNAIPVKKLPLHILLADPSFIKRITKRIGEKYWNAAKKKKTDELPPIKIEYTKYLGTVINEPEYESHA